MIVPTACLFQFSESHEDIWQSVAFRYPSQFAKKMSWRGHNQKFSRFLEFLEKEGQESRLETNVWQEIFVSHLSSLANRQFLFMLWSSVGAPIDFIVSNGWLPPEIAENLIRWRNGWETDNLIAGATEESSLVSTDFPPPSYRGIELPPIFAYESVRALMSNTLLTVAQRKL